MPRKYIIDLDGTVYEGETIVPGADDFIRYLNEKDIEYVFLTNCPSKSSSQINEKLSRIGICGNRGKIYTSGHVSAYVLSRIFKICSAYVIGTDALKEEVLKRDIKISRSSPDAVLVGYDTDISYGKLSTATHLVNLGAKLFATNIDNVIPFGNKLIPHTGTFAKALEYSTGENCTYIGKPEKYMMDYVLEKHGWNKEDCFMLGDRVDTDVAFAKNCNIKSLLLDRKKNSGRLDPESKYFPDMVFNNYNELIYKMKKLD